MGCVTLSPMRYSLVWLVGLALWSRGALAQNTAPTRESPPPAANTTPGAPAADAIKGVTVETSERTLAIERLLTNPTNDEVSAAKRVFEGPSLQPLYSELHSHWPLVTSKNVPAVLSLLRSAEKKERAKFLALMLPSSTEGVRDALVDELVSLGETGAMAAKALLVQLPKVEFSAAGLARVLARHIRRNPNIAVATFQELPQRAAIEVLVKLGASANFENGILEEKTLSLLGDAPNRVRLLRALVSFSSPRVRTEVLRIAKTGSRLERVRLSEALLGTSHEDVLPSLLEDADPRVREAACRSIGGTESGTREEVFRRVETLAEEDPWAFVREEGVETLRRKKRFDQKEVFERFRARMEEGEPSRSVRSAIRSALKLDPMPPKRPANLNDLRPKVPNDQDSPLPSASPTT